MSVVSRIHVLVPTSVLAVGLVFLGCGDDSRGTESGSGSNSNSQGSITLTGSDTDSDSNTISGSDSNTESTTMGPTVSGSNTDSSASASDSGIKLDLGFTPDFNFGCGSGDGMGMADDSYIWIPTTSDGTVTKIDTRTMTELARYATGPSAGTESVSRTAVSGDGRFVVVNSRGTGRSTAVAASIDDCIDQNNDGQIQTSSGVNDLLPWGQDECVVWTVTHPWGGSQQHGPRGITWTLGDWNEATCSYMNPKVWLGYMAPGGVADLVRLDGATGALEQVIPVVGWVGSGYAPYGGALDPAGNPWFTGLRGELVRVNANNNPIDVTRFSQPPNIQSYGMTVDPDGNPWMGGCSGPISTYDVQSNQWIEIAGTSACHRGMAVDHNFHVWTASNGPCELVEVDGVTRTLVAKHQLPQCSTAIGVSVDVDGYVWLVDQSGWAWKIDPLNVGALQQMPVAGNHYVYSDMTGGQLKSVAPPLG